MFIYLLKIFNIIFKQAIYCILENFTFRFWCKFFFCLAIPATGICFVSVQVLSFSLAKYFAHFFNKTSPSKQHYIFPLIIFFSLSFLILIYQSFCTLDGVLLVFSNAIVLFLAANFSHPNVAKQAITTELCPLCFTNITSFLE